RERSNVHAVEKCPSHRRAPNTWDEWPTHRNKKERRQEYSECCNHCRARSTKHVADERCRCEDWARRHLAHSDRVEQLCLRQPMPALDQIGANKSEQHISAAVEYGSDFQKEQKQGPQSKRRCAPAAGLEKHGQRRRTHERLKILAAFHHHSRQNNG